MRPNSSVPEIPLLSPSEFRIFAVLSHQGPLTIRDLGQKLACQDPSFSQGYNALGTLLLRMVKKGYVTQEDRAGTAGKLYRSVIPYDFVVRRQVENFLDTLPLVSLEDLQILGEVVQTRLASVSEPHT